MNNPKIVMVSGSRSISELPIEACESLDKIMQQQFNVIVGDADGVDKLVQMYLRSKDYKYVSVYYALFEGNGKPRNTSGYQTIGINGDYTRRDVVMCLHCDYALAIWDGKSKGTALNIRRVRKTKVIGPPIDGMIPF